MLFETKRPVTVSICEFEYCVVPASIQVALDLIPSDQQCCACIKSYVERLLDRISNGKLAEDRRNAMAELQSVVAESQAAQLAFGAMGELLVFF